MNYDYIIFSPGSLFTDGFFNLPNFRDKFPSIQSNMKIGNNIYVCGSASYLFTPEISDEDEIKFGTGLGLAITTSFVCVKDILQKMG